MKIEIDLNDILGDEYGTESIEDSVRRQVTDWLVVDFKKRVGKALDSEVTERVTSLVNDQLEAKFPVMIEELWEMKYVPVTRYGEVATESTLRNEILKTITKELVYKKTIPKKHIIPNMASNQTRLVFFRHLPDKCLTGISHITLHILA